MMQPLRKQKGVNNITSQDSIIPRLQKYSSSDALVKDSVKEMIVVYLLKFNQFLTVRSLFWFR